SLSKNTILNLGYLWGLAPTPPSSFATEGSAFGVAQRTYILDKLGYASRKTAFLGYILYLIGMFFNIKF
ncbi:hypothetical protein R4K48_14835, partial [Brachyspira pulli]|uniref:hypothetical protein n=1 Tax=Brachyspira pulli TaxID=310721 RepID=UPI0030074B80